MVRLGMAVSLLALLSGAHLVFSQEPKIGVAMAERTKWFGPPNGARVPGTASESDDKTVLVLALKGIDEQAGIKSTAEVFT